MIGEGYVFMCDSTDNILCPCETDIRVLTFLSEGRFPTTTEQNPITDINGKYCVRFIKHTKYCDAIRYGFQIGYYTGNASGSFGYSVDEIKNAKHTIIIDTIKVRKSH